MSSKDVQSTWSSSQTLIRLPTLGTKLLAREVIGWKWLQHENILPFVGVTPEFAIVSELMEHGSVKDFIANYPRHNRFHLVSNARSYTILV